MNKTLKNSTIALVSLIVIIYWIYIGLQNNNNEINNLSEENDNSDIIFQLLQKEESLVYDSIVSVDYISYSDTTNFVNILKNQNTHPSLSCINRLKTPLFHLLLGSSSKNCDSTYQSFTKLRCAICLKNFTLYKIRHHIPELETPET